MDDSDFDYLGDIIDFTKDISAQICKEFDPKNINSINIEDKIEILRDVVRLFIDNDICNFTESDFNVLNESMMSF